MKRRLFKLGVFLMVGAFISVAVAWGSVFFPSGDQAIYCNLGEPNKATRWYGGVREAFWTTFVWRSPTWVADTRFFSTNTGALVALNNSRPPAWSRIRIPVRAREAKAPQGFAELEEARGWPFRSLVGFTQMHIDLAQGGWLKAGQTWTLDLGREQWKGGPTAGWPVRPIILGLIANAMFYGGIAYLVRTLPRIVTRMRRHRRGLCPACAYPVGVSPVCTECGHPLRKQA